MRSLLSIFLALQVLAGSINVHGEIHFCGDSIVDIAFYGKAQSCQEKFGGKKEEMSACSLSEKKNGFNQGDCCKDRRFLLKGIPDGVKSLIIQNALLAKQVMDVFYAVSNKQANFFLTPNRIVKFRNYKPPLIQSDILVLIERFLI